MSRLNIFLITIIISISVLYSPNIFAQVENEPQVILSGHTWNAYDLAFNPDGSILATVSLDRTVRLWNTESGNELKVLTNEHSLESVAISPKGDVLVCGDQKGFFTVWDLKTYKKLKTLQAKNWVVRGLDFSHNGKMLANCVWSFGPDTVKIWDTETWEVIHPLAAGKAEDVAFSTDDKLLATGSLDDGTARVWDTDTGELLHELKTGMEHVFGVKFMINEHKLLVSGKDGLQMWDADSGVLLHTFAKQIHGFIRDLALNPDGRLLASATEEGNIYLWDLKTKTWVHTIEWHSTRVNAVAFSPDGMTLASTGQEPQQYLWASQPLGELIKPFSISPKDKATALWGDLKSD